ncbi:hypothetical protein EC968_002113 [Mortierella alpina]|nr:hypothetical protein EC968_002113 [Mortierella alpina]
MAATIPFLAAILAGLGAQKLYQSITAEIDLPLPSLKDVAQQLGRDCAYPEDYFPGGAYAELPFGETHYFLFGPDNGKRVVFVHGLSTPASVYSKVARQMAESGHRVLLYGAIVASYAYRFPESVESITFIAPGGLMLLEYRNVVVVNLACFRQPSEVPWIGKIFLAPYSEHIFSRKSMRSYFSAKNIESMKAEFKDGKCVPPAVEEATEILALQFHHHAGYPRGLMSTLKYFPLTGLQTQYAVLQQQPFPVQLVWVYKSIW